MAVENKIPTREECLACVKANKGEAAKKIAELADLCKREREGCLLAQQELDGMEQTNIEKNTEIE